MRLGLAPLLALSFAAATALSAEEPSGVRPPRPDKVAKVRSGEVTRAWASWWGFDAEDSTEFLQAAISSGVKELAIDRMASPWVVRPLKGASNVRIVLEKGAEIIAKAGEFRGKTDALLTFEQCENVRISGYGATLRMRHADYMKPPYEPSEWRHALWFDCCTNVCVEGVEIASSGGDGVYLTSRDPNGRNRDVVIRDVTCRDNHRQGISVISADNLLVENCDLLDTHGTPPCAGIDFEPNFPGHVLKRCVVRNCRARDNAGGGYEVNAPQMNHTSEPIDISFENCTSSGDGKSFFFNVDSVRGREVGGRLSISKCRFECPRKVGVSIRENVVTPLAIAISGSALVTTNAAGKKVETPLDAKWMAEHLPLTSASVESVERIVEPDFGSFQVRDPAPGALAKVSPLRVRGMVTYAFYADAARKVTFRGLQPRIGRYPARATTVAVTTVAGEEVASVPLPGFEEGEFSFAVPKAGFYRMKVMLGVGGFALTASDVPVAIDVTDRPQAFYKSVGGFWFVVPKGAQKFAVTAGGGGGLERMGVMVTNPRGKETWRRDNVGHLERFVPKGRPAPGIWSAWMFKPADGAFEDASCDLSGVPGFLFLDKDRIWE